MKKIRQLVSSLIKFISDKVHIIRWNCSQKYRNWCWDCYEKQSKLLAEEYEEAYHEAASGGYEEWLQEIEAQNEAEEKRYWDEMDRVQDEMYGEYKDADKKR